MRVPGEPIRVEADEVLASSARTRILPTEPRDEPTAARQPAAPAPASEPEPELVVPPRIRHFTVLKRVGQGGMGVVVSAYDDELDRKVAIKLLRPSQGGSTGRARMQREAQAMARLAHPNIVRVYEVGELDGQIYLVMEFVQGETLRRWLRRQKRPWREALAVVMQAGKGLAVAHAAGLVHRDFKPDNVMVAEDGFVRVLDFGLARSFDATDLAATAPVHATTSHSSPSAADQLTLVGTLIGTPAYMSPEQFACGPVDAHSDQFSFCVVLHEALYGHRPFKADTVAALREQIARLHAAEPPRKTGVPARLRRVILRGLAEHPHQRWPSMQVLLDELAREPGKKARLWLAGGGIAALAAGLSYVVAPRPGPQAGMCLDAASHLVGVWDADKKAAVAAALRATGVAHAEDTWQRVEQQLDAYTARWVAQHTASCEATNLRGEQSPRLMDLQMGCLNQRRTEVALLADALVVADAAALGRAVQAAMSLGSLDRCSDNEALMAEVPPPEDPARAAAVAELRAQLAGVKVAGNLGQFEASRATLERIVRDAAALGYPPVYAEALVRQGDLVDLAGDTAEAERILTEAFFTAGAARHDQVQAEAAVNLTFVIGAEEARFTEALAWDRHARMLALRLGDPVAMRISRLNGLGALMERWGKYSEGQTYLESALALAEQDAEAQPLKVATVVLNLGGMFVAQSNFTAAEQQYRRSLEIFTRVLGPDNPAVADCLNNLGQVAYQRADLVTAQDFFTRALATYERSMGVGHPRLVYPLVNLGNVAMARRDFRLARDYLTHALTLLETTRGPDDTQVGEPLGSLAELATLERDWDAAERHATRALALFEPAKGSDHPDLVQPLCALGEVALARRDLPRARGHFQRALAVAEKAYGPADIVVLAPLDGLTRVALAERHPRLAVPLLERALQVMTTMTALPDRHGATRFALARALWDLGGDRSRALELARLALADYALAGAAFTPEHAAVTTWLRAHE